MPDWKNEKDYTFTKSLTPEGWAWEFLRRNPRYQSDYAHVVKLKEEENAEYAPPKKDGLLRKEDLPHTRFYEPERLPDETRLQWKHRAIGLDQDPREYSLTQWYGKVWGLANDISDPASDQPPAFLPYRKSPEVLNWDSLSDYFEPDEHAQAQKPEMLVLGFDLTLSLKPQLKEAKRILEEKKKKFKLGLQKRETPRPDKWDTYLRILDSQLGKDQPSNAELAKVIYPSAEDRLGNPISDRANKARDAAQAMLENYRTCLLISA